MDKPTVPTKLVRITTVPMSLRLLLKGQMRYMAQQGLDVTMISSDGKEVPELVEQEQCKHMAIPFTRTISPLQDLYCLLKLMVFFARYKPHIVHTHTPKAGLLGMLAGKLTSVPIRLHTIAGLPWMESHGAKKWLLKQMEKLTAWGAQQVYPNSLALLQFLQREGIATNKLAIMGNGSSNGIDCTYFSKTEQLIYQGNQLRLQNNTPKNGWVWIFVGRLVKDKGIEELVAAFLQIQQQYSNDQLWLLGATEPMLDPLSKTCQEHIHRNINIIPFGFVKDIRPHLAAAEVLCFPSYREGFPNVPMQAAAMECTLLLSNINGCNELVQHLQNGLLVQPKSTADLVEKMLFIRTNPILAAQLRQNALQNITTHYAQSNLWQLWHQEYVKRMHLIHS